MNTDKAIGHVFDLSMLDDDMTSIERGTYFIEAAALQKDGWDCAGTFGTAGTAGGTFGSIGTWGCCCG